MFLFLFLFPPLPLARSPPGGPKRIAKTKKNKRGNGRVGVIWRAGWTGNARNWWWDFEFSLIERLKKEGLGEELYGRQKVDT